MFLAASSIDGVIDTSVMSARLETYRWEAPFENVHPVSEHALFRTFTSSPSCTRVSPVSEPSWSASFEGLGFWPGMPLQFRSSRPVLRLVSCRLVKERLEALTGFGEAWGVERPERCFALRNAKLEVALLGLAEEIANPGFAATLIVEGMGIMMLGELARHLQGQNGGPKAESGGLTPKMLKRVIELIGDAGAACPGVAELAKECALSERHLMRAFKAATGVTIGQYAEQHRAAKSCDLLRGKRAVKEIAFELGFSSVSHFSASFRKTHGITPTEFRNRVRF
jgi:AraC family transcriptional regulator